MSNINLTSIEQNLEKSGFLLEHQVSEKLMKNGWSIMNNRYYIDDVQETAREIDLLAYKAFPITLSHSEEKIWGYTALIISCKKSEKNLWAMLFRDINKKNPNMDWFPIKNWSNHKVLKYIIAETDWRAAYIKAAEDIGLYNNLFEPTGHLFAYQEIDKTKFTIQNQPNIFNAVSSLMKAESYEMSNLESRKKDAAVYNFNLISIVDSELVKVHCKGKKTVATEVNETIAIFNYIVNKKETASRIHFFTLDALEKCLKYYDELHILNKLFLNEQINDFYTNLLSDAKRVNVLKDEFSSVVLSVINHYCKYQTGWKTPFEKLNLHLSFDRSKLRIDLPESVEFLEYINGHKRINKITSEKLKKVFHYTGEFVFIDDNEIPF